MRLTEKYIFKNLVQKGRKVTAVDVPERPSKPGISSSIPQRSETRMETVAGFVARRTIHFQRNCYFRAQDKSVTSFDPGRMNPRI